LATLDENAALGWRELQKVHLVGPKIASWILRDISFMRDYARSVGTTMIRYRNNRNSAWFASLPKTAQRYFVPIDAWVFRFASQQNAICPRCRRRGVAGIQANPEHHLEAAEEIVEFARRRGRDPRDLDAFWYQRGAGYVDDDGWPVDEA